MLDSLTGCPALALGPCLDVLAWNSLAAALFTDFAQIPLSERNFVRLLFLEPEVRGRYVEWEDIARTCVAFFRMAVLDAVDDPRLTELVGDSTPAIYSSSETPPWGWARARILCREDRRFGSRHGDRRLS